MLFPVTGFVYPSPLFINNLSSFTAYSIGGATSPNLGFAGLFLSECSGSSGDGIAKIGFPVISAANKGTTTTYQLRVESIVDKLPAGELGSLGGGVGSGTMTFSGDLTTTMTNCTVSGLANNTFTWVTPSAPIYSPTSLGWGMPFAVSLTCTNRVGASDGLTVANSTSLNVGNPFYNPALQRNSSSVWSLITSYSLHPICIQYQSGRYSYGAIPVNTVESFNPANSSLLALAVSPTIMARVVGILFGGYVGGTSQFNIKVYQDTSAVYTSSTLYKTSSTASAGGNYGNTYGGTYPALAYFPINPITIYPGPTWRFAILNSAAQAISQGYRCTLPDLSSLQGAVGPCWASYSTTNGSSWTDFNSGGNGYKYPNIFLVLDQIGHTNVLSGNSLINGGLR